MRLEKQVKLVERLTEELGEVQKERDEWRCKYEDLEGGSTDTSNFTSIGAAAEKIIRGIVVHGFENDRSAARIVEGEREGIERAISYAVIEAVEQESERIKREIVELFGEKDT